jgi:gephyrin
MKKGPYVAEGLEITTAVIVMSDRAHAQVYEDQAGPALCAELAALNVAMRFTFVSTIVVPDEPTAIATAFLYCTDTLQVDLVITSGGTGFGPRDVTPETIRPLLHREAPGVVMALLNEGLKHTPLAVLSRPVVGTRGNCFVVTLPGSVKAVRENVRALEPLLPRIMTLLKSGTCEH